MELTNLAELKALLEKHHLWAKKSFGQNFLIHKPTLEKIITAGEIQKDDKVLEIGPGPGVLTRELCKHAGKVITIEKDRQVIPLLQETTAESQNLEILEEDALEYISAVRDFQRFNYKLIANLPYNIATPLLRNILLNNPPKLIVVLTQLEVAQKMCAQPGDMNVLALSIQPFGYPKIIAKVSPQAFFPPPKITSAIVKIEPYKTPLISPEIQEQYFALIHKAFGQKRKQLASTLKIPKEKLMEIGLKPNARPQELTIEDWKALVS